MACRSFSLLSASGMIFLNLNWLSGRVDAGWVVVVAAVVVVVVVVATCAEASAEIKACAVGGSVAVVLEVNSRYTAYPVKTMQPASQTAAKGRSVMNRTRTRNSP
jgi:hypothetical protein